MFLGLRKRQLLFGSVLRAYLRAGVFSLPSGLRSILNMLVGHSTHLNRASSTLSGSDAPGDDVSGCYAEHFVVSCRVSLVLREVYFEDGRETLWNWTLAEQLRNAN